MKMEVGGTIDVGGDDAPGRPRVSGWLGNGHGGSGGRKTLDGKREDPKRSGERESGKKDSSPGLTPNRE